jgi:hypothetical protein
MSLESQRPQVLPAKLGAASVIQSRSGAATHRLSTPYGVVDRIVDWIEEARSTGRTARAEQLLWMAWKAYDAPTTRAFRRGVTTPIGALIV